MTSLGTATSVAPREFPALLRKVFESHGFRKGFSKLWRNVKVSLNLGESSILISLGR